MKTIILHNCVGKRAVRSVLWIGVLVAGGVGVRLPAQDKTADRVPVVEGQVLDHRGSGVADVAVRLIVKDADEASAPIAEGTTNRYGDFAIHHAEALSGSYVLDFSKEGYTRTRRDVEIKSGGRPPFVDLILAGGMTFGGQVVDGSNGAPVAGARVRIEAGGRDWNTVTGADGTFSLEQVLPDPGALTVKAEGFARYKRVFDSLDASEPMRIKLGPERRCRLIIMDWRGDPVAGVGVTCRDDHLKEQWSGTSDAKGAVTLRGLSPESSSLRVRLTHARYVSDDWFNRKVSLPEGVRASEHTLTLLTAGSVRGRITEAGSGDPLQGVRVMVGADMNRPQPRGWTDFDGTYTIRGVPPGDTIVTTYLRGHAPELYRTKVKPNEASTVDLAMRRSKVAAGVVVDGEGRPVSGASVLATRWRGHSTLGVQAMTDEQGRFGFDTIPVDTFLVAVYATGYEPLDDQVITPGRTDHRLVLVRLAAAQGGASSGPKVGDAFPAVDLVTLDGKPLKFSDLKGKTVLVDFWATWCGPCVAEIPDLVRLHEAYGKRDDFVMINVSIDMDGSEKAVRRFVKKKKMDWAQVFGSKAGAQKLAEACGVTYVPRKLLVGPGGKVLLTELDGSTLKKTIAKYLEAPDAEPKDGGRKSGP